MNLSDMFGSSNPTKILRNLQEQPCNNYCIDCGESSASNVDCTHYTFVCVACSAIHREIGDQIKSVGVSTFTPEEIERLKETSNDDFNNTWMSGFKRGDQPLLPASNEETRRAFIFAKYRQKRWHKDSPKMATKSKRTMFPTEEDDSDNENINYTKRSSKNTRKFDEYDDDDDYDENDYQNYNAQQPQQMQNLRRGNPFGNNNYQPQQQQQNFFNQQNSFQQNQQSFQNNNFDKKGTNSSAQLSTSSKNAPFQKHKSSDHVHKKNKQKTFQQQQPPQIQQQPQFQQQQNQNQNDILIDLMSPQQPQNSSSSMQSAIDDIFGASSPQPQYQQQFSNQQYQYQQPQQNNFQQQQQNAFQQQQNNFQQNNFQQNSFQQQQNSFPQPQLNQQSSFPHKKNKGQQVQQKQQVQQTQQVQQMQNNNNSLDDIFGFAPTSTNQPQNQSNQVDDLFNFGLPNDSSNSRINDDELLDFSNPQIAAEQQQHYEKRRQLKEAMVNISDDDMKNVHGNNNIQRLRNEGLGVQDSPTFMAKALIASGYCSQPVNQPIPRMGMPAQQPMYYSAYQGYQQNQNQYYKPQ